MPAGNGEGELPYREFALFYNELVGEAAFECWRENFERLTGRYAISYEVAADIACGTGKAVGYLARRCRRVYAVDRSPWMLDIARSEVLEENVVFLEQSFATLKLPEPVDLLTCNFDSLNYLTDEQQLGEALEAFARSLKPGGTAVFDVNTAGELNNGGITGAMVHRTREAVSVWETQWDSATGVHTLIMTNFLKVEGGLYRMSREVHRERAYSPAVILRLAEAAGFRYCRCMDARDLGAVDESTRRAQFMAGR